MVGAKDNVCKPKLALPSYRNVVKFKSDGLKERSRFGVEVLD